jgi:hypothetical protein
MQIPHPQPKTIGLRQDQRKTIAKRYYWPTFIALRVTGLGFQQGAKVEINGQAQKIANDETNPATLLLARKAGNFIQSGTTGQLTGVNPNSTRSPQFAFTRP